MALGSIIKDVPVLRDCGLKGEGRQERKVGERWKKKLNVPSTVLYYKVIYTLFLNQALYSVYKR